MIAWLLKAGKARILAGTAASVALIAFADWLVGRNVSLAALYILPMMLAAVVLRPWESACLAIFFSYLRAQFDVPGSRVELFLRFVFSVLAYFVSALFVTALVKKHVQAVQHLSRIQYEQALRREAEERLRALVEGSPAAVFTVDASGTVLDSNRASDGLFAIPEGESLVGRPIGRYLPTLTDALQMGPQRRLRAAVQCQGNRENAEIFLAHVWFSSYTAPEGNRLAAIVVDSSEELRDREEQGLRHLMKGNRIAAAAVAHEVRNFCGAMAILCGNLSERHALNGDADLQGLLNLAGGLESIASLNLKANAAEILGKVPLRTVLDELRIVVEPDWREIEGTVRWHIPKEIPAVVAEPHGLMQAFLNLVQNSHRAVQEVEQRQLDIEITAEGKKVVVRFRDSGPGVSLPDRLFQPFQEGAAGSGMGLYVSRFIVRSYGGELSFEPQPNGACFAVELLAVPEIAHG